MSKRNYGIVIDGFDMIWHMTRMVWLVIKVIWN